jgi:acyl-CoA synthetase (AMP-forming)/AMP-acid ligase II
MDLDGCITFVDRKKDLIITGGENIYPWEIEELFHSHYKVADIKHHSTQAHHPANLTSQNRGPGR